MSAAWTERTAPDGSSPVEPLGVTIASRATRRGRRTSHTARAPRATRPATIATTAITDIVGASHASGLDCSAGPTPRLSRSLRVFGRGAVGCRWHDRRMAEPPALDAPVAGLGDAEALAKAWLLELVAARPLGEATRSPAERSWPFRPGARRRGDRSARLRPRTRAAGPRRATSPGSPLRPVRSPAPKAPRTSWPPWSACGASCGRPSSARRRVGRPVELAGRLAHVCATVAETALAAASRRGRAARAAAGRRARPDPRGAGGRRAAVGGGARAPARRRLALGRRFALLLVELDAAEHLRLAGAEEAAAAFARSAGPSASTSAAPMSSPTRTTAGSG